MKVAFVHDWLVTYRGGEKVLEAMLELYPNAPIFTLFHQPGSMPPSFDRHPIVASHLNSLRKVRKGLLPLMPRAIESFDMSDFDLILSTSSCVAKGVIPAKQGKHLCYLHSPMRYIWDQQEEYLRGLRKIPGAASVVKAFTPSLQRWDVKSSSRVDRFVVNSRFVAQRAKDFYERDATVIPPPVELDRFTMTVPNSKRSDYVLAAGALVSYKRFDLAIAACEAIGKRLIIAGRGPMENQLRQQAGKHTEFEIGPDDKRFTELMQNAQALLFPGVEDFGMTAIEAMACGTPVLAFESGGALDFIQPGFTGEFFKESTVDSLAKALESFAHHGFDGEKVSQYASQYDKEGFLEKMRREIGQLTGSDS